MVDYLDPDEGPVDDGPIEVSEELQLAIEQSQAVKHLTSILGTNDGIIFFRYLVRVFDIGGLPEIGLEADANYYRHLGAIEAANAIFELVSEANVELAGKFLAEKMKGQYAKRMAEDRKRRG